MTCIAPVGSQRLCQPKLLLFVPQARYYWSLHLELASGEAHLHSKHSCYKFSHHPDVSKR